MDDFLEHRTINWVKGLVLTSYKTIFSHLIYLLELGSKIGTA